MSDLLFTVEPATQPSTSRGKPKLVLRGLRRKHVKNLLRALKQMLTDDTRESARGARQGYSPMLFQGAQNGPGGASMKRIMTRCQQMLDAKQ